MAECAFDLILREWFESEWEVLADASEFKTSKKHDRAMQRIFKRYERHTQKLRSHSDFRTINVQKRFVIAILVIILAALAGCTAAYFISQSFRGVVRSDNTELRPISYENCPTVIEDKYYLSELPEEFEILDSHSTPFFESVSYENTQTGQTITFSQWAKPEFDPAHYNTEKGELIEVEINGHSGVFLDLSDDYESSSQVLWDNGDYILELAGNFNKNNLLNLAKSAKVL